MIFFSRKRYKLIWFLFSHWWRADIILLQTMKDAGVRAVEDWGLAWFCSYLFAPFFFSLYHFTALSAHCCIVIHSSFPLCNFVSALFSTILMLEWVWNEAKWVFSALEKAAFNYHEGYGTNDKSIYIGSTDGGICSLACPTCCWIASHLVIPITCALFGDHCNSELQLGELRAEPASLYFQLHCLCETDHFMT